MRKLKQNILIFLVAVSVILLSWNLKTIDTGTIFANQGTAVTQTESGKVAGYISNGVFTFKGIPYAKAERFMPPVKPDNWEGVRSSRAYGPVCPAKAATMVLSDEIEFAQQHNFGFMNENCLNLNIWTKGLTDGKKRPVMVWLHGGGFLAGSSRELPTYDGENLSNLYDVVVVSVNHRLNVLGFLDLSGVNKKYKYSANVGMLDLVAALEWVKNNITNFGGDPDNVTVFGQSGGAAKVGTLMHMPKAKGLFHKAILQSGAGGTFIDTNITRQVGYAILDELGLNPGQADSLENIPFEQLLTAGDQANKKISEKIGTPVKLEWVPSMDGEIIPFQVGTPEAQEISKNIPLIIGTNKNEFMSSPLQYPYLLRASEAEIKAILQKKLGDKTNAYIAAYKEAYPNDTVLSNWLDVDYYFRPGSLKYANQKSAYQGTAPIYMYVFTWQSPMLDGSLKAIHCMEIGFVFNNINRNREMTGDGKEVFALADIMSSAWCRFAATGNPNGKVLPQWKPYTGNEGATMLFDNNCELKYHHDKKLMEFGMLK